MMRLIVAACALSVCLGIQISVLLPIKEGQDVALIGLPGASLEAKQYRQLGETFQKVNDQRAWVAFAGDFLLGTINPLQITAAISQALRELDKAGMPKDTPVFVAGHSLAGVFLQDVVTDFQRVKGMILWASYLSKGKLANYKIPVLTVAGDLDGQTRITRIAKQFRELQSLVAADREASLKFPIVVAPGVNHQMYFTGNIPDIVKENDITTTVTKLNGQTLIAKATQNFMAYHSKLTQNTTQKARDYLEQNYKFTSQVMKPIIDSMDLEQSTNGSAWVIQAQRMVSRLVGTDIARLSVSNNIVSILSLPVVKPTITIKDGKAVIQTYVYLSMPFDPIDVSTNYQTADGMSAKMKSRDGIKKALNDDKLNFSSPITCKDINKAAWDLALKTVSSTARQRFIARGIKVVFNDDKMSSTGPGWLMDSFDFKFSGNVVEMTSASIVTSTDAWFGTDGQHYCKMLSPARAVEFIMVDGLRV